MTKRLQNFLARGLSCEERILHKCEYCQNLAIDKHCWLFYNAILTCVDIGGKNL